MSPRHWAHEWLTGQPRGFALSPRPAPPHRTRLPSTQPSFPGHPPLTRVEYARQPERVHPHRTNPPPPRPDASGTPWAPASQDARQHDPGQACQRCLSPDHHSLTGQATSPGIAAARSQRTSASMLSPTTEATRRNLAAQPPHRARGSPALTAGTLPRPGPVMAVYRASPGALRSGRHSRGAPPDRDRHQVPGRAPTHGNVWASMAVGRQPW
jgi:hypothetical protein